MIRVRHASVLCFLSSVSLVAAVDRCLVPASIREPLLDEIAGENALRHAEFLAANRDRQPQEYADRFLETTYLSDRLREYGLEPTVDFFPEGEMWDAEAGHLWLGAPHRTRVAGPGRDHGAP